MSFQSEEEDKDNIFSFNLLSLSFNYKFQLNNLSTKFLFQLILH